MPHFVSRRGLVPTSNRARRVFFSKWIIHLSWQTALTALPRLFEICSRHPEPMLVLSVWL